ncbi:MAG: peptide ABC transporter substrate-binding protein, partial [Gemmatimonadaceae bacterium]
CPPMLLSMRSSRRASLALVLASLAACGDRVAPANTATGGTVIISAPADADLLFPPLAGNETAIAVVDQIFDRLAVPDSTLQLTDPAHFAPQLARSWDWARDSLSVVFHLDPAARWHDGPPVRASDVRFTFDVYRDSAVGTSVATLLGNIDSVTARDSATVIFWFKRRSPYQFFDATYQTRILPEHVWRDVPRADMRKHELARKPVGSGRFRFVRWMPGSSIEVASDTMNYRGRAKLDRVIWTIAPDAQARVARLMTGEADVTSFLRAEHLAELPKHPTLRSFGMLSLSITYLMFNLQAPGAPNGPARRGFADRPTRRALSMAVDRVRLTRSVVDSLGLPAIAGVPRLTLAGDTVLRQLAYDPAAARRLLDSAGWHLAAGDSVRRHGAEALRFSVLVPSTSAPRRLMAVLLKDMLRQVGAQADLEILEVPPLMQRLHERRFDAIIHNISVDPGPSSVRQMWTSAAARGAEPTNYGAYENAAFDALIDSADAARDARLARDYSHRAYQLLSDDAPGIWLYEPRNIMGIHTRIRTAGIRDDAWWAGLADWTIDPAARLPRDNRTQRQASQ